jgi:hypothetical protein
MFRRRAISDLLIPGAVQSPDFRGVYGRCRWPTQPFPIRACTEAIRASGALKRLRRNPGGTTASTASNPPTFPKNPPASRSQ